MHHYDGWCLHRLFFDMQYWFNVLVPMATGTVTDGAATTAGTLAGKGKERRKGNITGSPPGALKSLRNPGKNKLGRSGTPHRRRPLPSWLTTTFANFVVSAFVGAVRDQAEQCNLILGHSEPWTRWHTSYAEPWSLQETAQYKQRQQQKPAP